MEDLHKNFYNAKSQYLDAPIKKPFVVDLLDKDGEIADRIITLPYKKDDEGEDVYGIETVGPSLASYSGQ